VIGITGTGGAGKSTYTDEIVRNFQELDPEISIAILSIDPTKKKTGGALLGDRIRMNSIYKENVFMRSMATREDYSSTSPYLSQSIELCKKAGYDLILVETAGIGQSDSRIAEICDFSIYIMTPEFGAQTQLEKIDMLDYADMVVINKFDRKGALDAKRDVSKQYQRSRTWYDKPLDSMPVFGTIASQFNNRGVKESFQYLVNVLQNRFQYRFEFREEILLNSRNPVQVLPTERSAYLLEIVNAAKEYKQMVLEETTKSELAYQLKGSLEILQKKYSLDSISNIQSEFQNIYSSLQEETKKILETWEQKLNRYKQTTYSYTVRDKTITVENYYQSLSQLQIPKISLPKYQNWGSIVKWSYEENVPGEFPYTSGVYPYKREGEDPIRMFAGEGGPERTNKRFHYLSQGQLSIRLSTAFDSVTLYGENPSVRPDIYGKIGNSGVSVASLDDAKRLYSGFDLCQPNTSVSMTINGPAPMILAYFLNAAIDQQCEIYIQQNGLTEKVKTEIQKKYQNSPIPTYRGSIPSGNNGLGLLLLGITGDQILEPEIYQKIKDSTLQKVRGTVQADILKEDQAQNTCIFSTEFALKLMGDVQEYFIKKQVKNFYSVSVSGYHISEAGANPITQLAFTLSNGFTLLEYYLSRGMKIDDFAPNFSFFFSNGMDPEYSVIGRVARRIWAKAIRNKYKGSTRSQLLKYHIQTSGRSLHSQEIAFNDIRTTLQALYAIYDNCNSLHTNAYDEAITTPTEESVRRAVAIQLIINRELGTSKSENFLQGSFAIEELTDLVEEAVYSEFLRLNDRGGVLGAMETMYQRNKIQEESLYYETRKQSGDYTVIGVNSFIGPDGSPTIIPSEVIRSNEEEKMLQVEDIQRFEKFHSHISENFVKKIKNSARQNENVFTVLMDACKYLSLGQMTHALYEVGGQYRRNF
jgi:methylmalonyl-CoA mutase